MRKYREYSDDDVIKYAKEVKSMAKLLTKLGLKTVGGNYNHMKHTLQRLQIDTSHWTGQAWNRNEQLKDWSQYSRVNGLKKHLIELRGHQCENCKNSYNCYNCKNCDNCDNCDSCIDCKNLDCNKDCNNCENITNSIGCNNCKDCHGLEYCDNCIDC